MKNDEIKVLKAALWYKSEANLGEGPLWLPHSDELIWVDINNGEVHATNATTKEDKIIYQGEKTSCVVSISNEEFLIADKDNLIRLNRINETNIDFKNIDFKIPNLRFNDGKVDPNGNFWLGTMEMDFLPNKGNLYLVETNKKVSVKVKNITISNGLSWSLNKKTMYYIDTADRVVYAFDFNENSEISNQRVAIEIPKELGFPDGMTIDNKGNLWIAMWGGSSVICFNPKSRQMLKKVELNAPHVTSCTFGGQNMDILLITTAREGLSSSQLKKYPNSGSLYYVKTDVKGIDANYFKLK